MLWDLSKSRPVTAPSTGALPGCKTWTPAGILREKLGWLGTQGAASRVKHPAGTLHGMADMTVKNAWLHQALPLL